MNRRKSTSEIPFLLNEHKKERKEKKSFRLAVWLLLLLVKKCIV